MYNQLLSKEKKLALVGLGYVGLPIALEFGKTVKVIGFDISEERIDLMRRGIDPSKEKEPTDFLNTDIEYTSSLDKLQEASFYIVAVPTPIDNARKPDLKPLLSATSTVGKVLKKGDYVVYESTVYPGCTEEDCIPILEKFSGLKAGLDFKVGYSPERINPGDKIHTLTNTVKIVSGCDDEALDTIAKVYEIVIKAGVHRAESIKVAEAAKIIENTQRDVNIALMNELDILFHRMDINVFEVLEAASTKWNFLNFSPGLVGGHCIGVDPYYLVHKAAQLNYHAKMITSGRFVNDSMGGYLAKRLVKMMINLGSFVKDTKVLIMGFTFKEDVSDVRNTKVIDIINELLEYGVKIEVVDPYADSKEVEHEYGIKISEKAGSNYDGVVVAVAHQNYLHLDADYFSSLLKPGAVLFDIKGLYRKKFKDVASFTYKCL